MLCVWHRNAIGEVRHGIELPDHIAQAWVVAANKKYPEIEHWAAPLPSSSDPTTMIHDKMILETVAEVRAYAKGQISVAPGSDLSPIDGHEAIDAWLAAHPDVKVGVEVSRFVKVAVSVLPHGYDSDHAALRAIVTLYSEATTDATIEYYAVASGASYEAEIRRMSRLENATRELRTALGQRFGTPRSRLEKFGAARYVESAQDRAWHARVAADVIARIDGDMARPLPESADLDATVVGCVCGPVRHMLGPGAHDTRCPGHVEEGQHRVRSDIGHPYDRKPCTVVRVDGATTFIRSDGRDDDVSYETSRVATWPLVTTHRIDHGQA